MNRIMAFFFMLSANTSYACTDRPGGTYFFNSERALLLGVPLSVTAAGVLYLLKRAEKVRLSWLWILVIALIAFIFFVGGAGIGREC